MLRFGYHTTSHQTKKPMNVFDTQSDECNNAKFTIQTYIM